MKKRVATLGMIAAATLALVGCTDSGATTTSEAAASGELTEINVAALPIGDSVAVWLGVEAGIFEEHGIDLQIQTAHGGAQAIPSLLSGDIQFAIGGPFGPFRADVQDLGITVVQGFSNTIAVGQDNGAVVVLEDSPIQSTADLAGKKIGVNTTGAAGDLSIRAAVDAAGGDSNTIEFVEVNFPDAQAQLEAGTIDAAWVPDPFRTQINEVGRTVLYNFQETIPGVPVLTSFTTAEIVENDPELVELYAAAMADALAYTTEHPDEARAVLVKELGLSEEAAQQIVFPEFNPELKMKEVTALAEMAVKYGYLDAMPNLEKTWIQF